MADPHFIAYDPDADPGERLPPEVRAEVADIAPSAVLNGSITEAKLKDDAVTQPKIAAGAVGPTELADNAVEPVNLAGGAVTTPKIAAEAVTPPKCGTGVVTMKDSTGNDIDAHGVRMTETAYAALGSPDPNTFYFLSS